MTANKKATLAANCLTPNPSHLYKAPQGVSNPLSAIAIL